MVAIDDSEPLLVLLRKCLETHDNHAVRTLARKVSCGYSVALMTIPRRMAPSSSAAGGETMAGGSVMDFSKEKEIASDVQLSLEKAVRVACYKALQERFPDELVAEIERHPQLLDDML